MQRSCVVRNGHVETGAGVIECDVGLAVGRASVRVYRCVHVMGTGVSLLGFFGVSPSGCTVNTVHREVATAPIRRRLCCNYGDCTPEEGAAL